MTALPVVEGMSDPGLSTKNHIERQKPPRRHPKPSVTSLKTNDSAPNYQTRDDRSDHVGSLNCIADGRTHDIDDKDRD